MRRLHIICAVLLLVAAPVHAQQPAPQPGATSGYTVFLRGTPLGREDIGMTTDASGTIVSGRSRLGLPLNVTLRRVEIRYGPDWTPASFASEGTLNDADLTVRTTFTGGTAATDGRQGKNPIAVSHQVPPRSLVLPTVLYGGFAGYAALARRLASTEAGTEIPAYILPLGQIGLRVVSMRVERMQVGTSVFNVRRYELLFTNPGGNQQLSVTTTEDGTLVRLNDPVAALDVVREDIAASTSRTEVFSNPGEESVTIAAPGFNLAATVTRPKTAPTMAPAVVLVSSSSSGDRDGFGFGVPFLGQLAGSLADAGFLVVRYDRRGFGQSGGRSESATLGDYADDVRTVVRWLGERKDVDRDRVAIVGHGDGGWVALLAAARERRRIAAVATLGAPGSTGGELLLEQQQGALDRLNLDPAEREQRIALQKQIHAAVATGKGWENIPKALRADADTAWLQSVLAFDPARTVSDVRQPLLIIHGALDQHVPVAHADRLATLARGKDGPPSVEVVIVRGIDHLLLPGDGNDSGTAAAPLRDRVVSADVTSALSGWLTRTTKGAR
jgi:pimeloyl-ACP methyl ester carboxylesterase